jgi:hypothetical protein
MKINLKEKFIILALSSLAVTPITALANTEYGLFVGYNLANTEHDDDRGFDIKSKNEYAIGGIFEYSINNNWSVQAEPMYIQKGSNIDVPGYGSIETTYGYLKIPVNFKRYLTSGDTRVYTTFGPYFSYLISAEQEASFIPSEAEDIKEYTNNTDYGIELGFGVKFPALSNNAFIQVKYSLGLADTDDTGLNEVKHRGFLLSLGYTF